MVSITWKLITIVMIPIAVIYIEPSCNLHEPSRSSLSRERDRHRNS